VVDSLLRNHVATSSVLLLCLFFPLFWISQYNYPAGDDYLVFFQAQSLGAVGATRWWYRNWSGRYASLFLQSMFSEHASWLVAYKVVPIALFVLGFVSLFAFLRALFGTGFRRAEMFTLTSCIYAFLIGVTRDMATGFYWVAASTQNTSALFITLLILALHIRIGRTSHLPTRSALTMIGVVLIAVLAGLNEVSLMLFVWTVASVACFQTIRCGRVPRVGVIFLAASVAFGLISFLAPGNFVRSDRFGKELHLIELLTAAIALTAYLFMEILALTPLLLASGLYLVFLEVNRSRLGHVVASLSEVRWYWVALALAGAFTFTSVGLLTGVNMYSVPGRVQNVYAYSIILAWFFFVTVLFANLNSRGCRFHLQKWASGSLTLAIVLFLMTGFEVTLRQEGGVSTPRSFGQAMMQVRTHSVYSNAYLDILTGRGRRYAMQNREATRRFRAPTDGCVEFPPVIDVPETIFAPVKYPWTWCPREVVRLHERYSERSRSP
jgi:hypothetical protein